LPDLPSESLNISPVGEPMGANANLTHIRIVLVEPAGARNVGSVARVMKNMGLQQLVLVNPHCDPVSLEAQHMAVHAADVLVNAVQADSIPEALQGCTRVVATTSRDNPVNTPTGSPRQLLPPLVAQTQPAALLFGPEDRGLSDAELAYAQIFLRIPSHPVYPSLNLAQAVGICGYELYQSLCLGQPEEEGDRDQNLDLASFEALEAYFQHLETVLLQIGYLYPHTQASRMAKFRRLFSRTGLSVTEVAMLRGMLRQFSWCLGQQSSK
jgi:tRNA/rRNA methyltransferase